jgi:hypothetical protein
LWEHRPRRKMRLEHQETIRIAILTLPQILVLIGLFLAFYEPDIMICTFTGFHKSLGPNQVISGLFRTRCLDGPEARRSLRKEREKHEVINRTLPLLERFYKILGTNRAIFGRLGLGYIWVPHRKKK